MLFAVADGADDIRNADVKDENSRKVVQSVFGDSRVDKSMLGDALVAAYGVAGDGAGLVTCMFAVH